MEDILSDKEFIIGIVKGVTGLLLAVILGILWANFTPVYNWFYTTFPKARPGTLEFLQIFFFFPVILTIIAFLYEGAGVVIKTLLTVEAEETM